MRHAKELPEHRRICQDGVPHMCFFDTRTRIGFMWTGDYDSPIEVTQGGCNEPVTNLIEYTVDHRPLLAMDGLPLPTQVLWFGNVCRTWLQRITADLHAEEPRMVKEVW